MAKRRTKSRTHKKLTEEEMAKIPKSMVLRLGSSLKNASLSQLVKDFRFVMQPHTAINLRERKSNKLKDFIVIAGPLGVSELFVFNQSEETGNISLRIGKMPRGPNLQFKINNYSLVKDVKRILKQPKSIGRESVEFLEPPLLVMNGFLSKLNEAEPHEKLLVTIFQNLFPPIQPQLTKVSSIKRVMMLDRDPITKQIELRHYAIDTKLVDTNRNVKKLIASHHNLKKKLPNLSKTEDASDLLLDPYSVGGATSDSEVEDDQIVEVKQDDQTSAKQQQKKKSEANNDNEELQQPTRKKAIKLVELGPRINMSLTKIEEGLVGSSKTIYHSQITKTKEQLSNLEKQHQIKQRLKEERRAKQMQNLQAKNAKKEEQKARKQQKYGKGDVSMSEGEDEGEDDDENDQENDQDQDDNSEINPDDYENDSDLFSDIEK